MSSVTHVHCNYKVTLIQIALIYEYPNEGHTLKCKNKADIEVPLKQINNYFLFLCADINLLTMGPPTGPFYKRFLNICNAVVVYARKKIRKVSKRREAALYSDIWCIMVAQVFTSCCCLKKEKSTQLRFYHVRFILT